MDLIYRTITLSSHVISAGWLATSWITAFWTFYSSLPSFGNISLTSTVQHIITWNSFYWTTEKQRLLKPALILRQVLGILTTEVRTKKLSDIRMQFDGLLFGTIAAKFTSLESFLREMTQFREHEIWSAWYSNLSHVLFAVAVKIESKVASMLFVV